MRKRRLEKEWLAWQSESTSNYHRTELEKRIQVHDLKNEIYEKADLDMERLLQFSEYMTEALQLETNMKLEIDKKIRNRSNDIRTFARELGFQLLQEINEGAAEGRQEVRDKGEEERDKINNR